TALGPHRSMLRVHTDALHHRHVDHEAPVVGPVTRCTVAAAAHRDDKTVQARELDRPLNVGNTGAARDHPCSPIDIPVPHPPGHFVARVLMMDQFAAKDLLKILKVCCVERSAIRLDVARSHHSHVGTSNRIVDLTLRLSGSPTDYS